jgi:error-prone DNA polymerase
LAEGRVEREATHAEMPIFRIICRRLIDRSDLLDSLLAEADGDRGAWGQRALGRADEVRTPEPGSVSAAPRLLRSRDFR